MKKKILFTVSAFLLTATSAAHADYYNSFGAKLGGSFDLTETCDMASDITEQILARHKANAPEMETLEGDELEAFLEEAEANHKTIAIEQSVVKAYSYDLDQFSSAEEFKEQFYQDCLEDS